MRQLFLAALLLAPVCADAFCGFYVAGGDAKLFNNATQVVLMRDGTRTVLSMQNNYQGPPENFAMVIPVPVVLKKEQVKTLPRDVFARVDQLSAPRLVEYWEQDPCAPDDPSVFGGLLGMAGSGAAIGGLGGMGVKKVKIEAQFSVGEYDIVVLSAKDALGLEQWLKQNKYAIPENAAPLFRPYIQLGMKFFVARVDVKKVKFEKGQAQLSPLRFHYDTEKFELPIRLGLINAKEKQDLIVHILARNQRYEVANYPNVTIPTNIDLAPSAQSEFPYFYVSLFDRTLKATPKAVVTEYAWQASTCDPCPTEPLSEQDLLTLGSDVVSKPRNNPWGNQNQFVLTRLHARYDKDSAGEDLVFRAAKPIVGGREFMLTGDEGVERGAAPSSVNNFQGRYAIRHPWPASASCAKPVYSRWGANPAGHGTRDAKTALGTAFIERDEKKVDALAEGPIPELKVAGLKRASGLSLSTPKKK